MPRIVFIIALALLSFSAPAQYVYNYNDRCLAAYNEILSLRFDNARIYIEKEKHINPDNNVPYLLDNYIAFLTLLINEQEDAFKRLKKERKHIFDRLDEGDERSPYYRYSLAQANLQWALVRAKFREYVPALQEINRAYRLLEENQEEFPEFKPNLINLGILHSLIGTIPENLEWIKNILGVEGTISQGVNELFTALEASLNDPEYAHLKAECLFCLSFIQLNLTKDKSKALEYAGYFEEDFDLSSNPLVIYALSRIYMNNGMNDKAIEVLLMNPQGEEYFRFLFIDYITGLAKLYRQEKDALIYLLSFALNFKGENYIKAAYQKISWYYLTRGDTIKYKNYMDKILEEGNTLVDADKQAEREAKRGVIPNVVLLKARLLFDGGYHRQAAEELTREKNGSFLADSRDSLEYTYRLGRIYHEWGEQDKAIAYYMQTIEMGSQSEYYYAANAALKLGIIYENRSDYEKAAFFFRAAQSMNNKEYKNSIDQKAKAGLNRLDTEK